MNKSLYTSFNEQVFTYSSKSVTITQTVTYKLRATNDNGSIDSSSIQISLEEIDMPKIVNDENNLGLVVQKSMVRSSDELASVLVVYNQVSGSA